MSKKTKGFWIFTDGACSGNPGPGGWAFLVRDLAAERVVECGGYRPQTTNNQMELEAVCQALQWIRKHASEAGPITVFSDSSYVIQGITQWIHGWKKNNWVKKDQSLVLNREYWERLSELNDSFGGSELEYRHVRAHGSNEANNRVDEIAVGFSTLQEVTLYDGADDVYSVDLSGSVEEVLKASSTTAGGSGSSKKSLVASSAGKRSASGPAYYLSYVDGRLLRHTSWPDCELAVKGKKNAKFKKIKNPAEESDLLTGWGLPHLVK